MAAIALRTPRRPAAITLCAPREPPDEDADGTDDRQCHVLRMSEGHAIAFAAGVKGLSRHILSRCAPSGIPRPLATVVDHLSLHPVRRVAPGVRWVKEMRQAYPACSASWLTSRGREWGG